jgi:branched-chain amino acid transport system permease protein
MSGIPRPDLSSIGVSADDPRVFYYYVLAVAAVMIVLLWRIQASPFGSVLFGIRENERRAMAMGYAVQNYKIGAFVVSAVFCATAGILQAQYTYFVNPDGMSWQASGEGILMVIIGGSSAVLGPMVGAAIYVLVKQVLSFITTEYLMAFGIFFMLVVVLFRDGVFGTAGRIFGSGK